MAIKTFRKKLVGGINFMSLQDMFTAVIGILIVFSIILILSSKKPESASRKAEVKADLDLNQLTKKITTLEALINKGRSNLVAQGPLQSQQTASNVIKRIEDELKKMGTLVKPGRAEALSQQNDDTHDEIAQLQQQIQQNQIKIDRLLAALKGDQRSSLFLLGDNGNKKVLILEIGGSTVISFWLDTPQDQQQTPVDDAQAIGTLLDVLDKDQHHVVCFVRPTGVLLFRKISGIIKGKGVTIGTDSLPVGEKLNLMGAN